MLAGVTVVVVVIVVVGVAAVGLWQCRRRHLHHHHHHHHHNACTTHSSRHKLADETHTEKTNNENEEKLWRYHNSLKPATFTAAGDAAGPSCSRGVTPQGPGDPRGAPLASPATLGGMPKSSLATPETDLSDCESPTHGLPTAMRKVQNADVERNMTPHDPACKSLQKEINLKGLSPTSSNHDHLTSEMVV